MFAKIIDNFIFIKVVAEFKCNVCEKLEMKIKKQKEKYENKIKELEDNEKNLKEDLTRITKQVEHALMSQFSLEKERSDLQTQLIEYDQYASR